VTPGGRRPTEVTHPETARSRKGPHSLAVVVGTKSYDTGRVADPSGAEQHLQFAQDSLVEEGGFEPSVPRVMDGDKAVIFQKSPFPDFSGGPDRWSMRQ